MKDTTLISVVTPIYNGARFIASAYDCLCRQTYKQWEWVVVDDGSTDDTKELMSQLSEKDRRVKYTWQRNSGSAKLPRDRAVFQAKGNYILPFDIDDRIAPDYLEKMWTRLSETEADIVYAKMIFIDLSTNDITLELPVKDFDVSRIYHGMALIKETLPEWRIGCNGGLYRRQIWVNMSWLEEHEPIWTYSDEVDERYYLMEAERVAFTDAQYYYQTHSDSITNKPSMKLFDILKNNRQLSDFIAQKFGRDSEEYRLANIKAMNCWRNMMAYYLQRYEELTDADGQIQQDLKESFEHIEPSLLPFSYRLQFLNLSSLPLVQAMMALKYAPHWITEKLQQHFSPEKYRFNVIRKRTEQQMYQQVIGSYTEEKRCKNAEPCAIYMSCGNLKGGGLIDRLRGAISLYATCKENGRPFRLFFTHPFPLTDYLQPNEYDWRIEEEKVSFAPSQTHIFILDTQTDSTWERQWQQEQFQAELQKTNNQQLHVYSNALFCYDMDFAKLFNELFKPSERLQASIDKMLKEIGGPYVTISARFCNLLGDFNEETFSEPLPRTAQKKLISDCLKQIEQIHEQNSGLPIIVCSDSTTFMDEAEKADYVSVIPGTVSHIGNDTTHFYHYYEKTFLDFFIISKAQQAYLLYAKSMHNSGYPYAAARMGKKPYHVIEI